MAAHQSRNPDGQEKGLLFSGSDCDSAFAGDRAVFALGTSSTYRAFQTAHCPWHSALVWYLPGCDTAAHVPARPPAPSHPRNKHSSELSSQAEALLEISQGSNPKQGKVNYIKTRGAGNAGSLSSGTVPASASGMFHV